MAYYATSPSALEGDPIPENRVWGFFSDPNKSRLPNRLQSPQPRRRNRATTTKPVSGIPLWPSRDPIGENWSTDEFNVYAFILNQPTNAYDHLGLEIKFADAKSRQAIEYLWKWGDPHTVEMIAILLASDHCHTIDAVDAPPSNGRDKKKSPKEEDESNGKGASTITKWNPKGMCNFSAYSVLVHELFHALEKDRGVIEPREPRRKDPATGRWRRPRPDKDKNGYPDSEDRAVDAGNHWRRHAGEYEREDYGDLNPYPYKRYYEPGQVEPYAHPSITPPHIFYFEEEEEGDKKCETVSEP